MIPAPITIANPIPAINHPILSFNLSAISKTSTLTLNNFWLILIL